MSGFADIPAKTCYEAHQPLRFGEYLERINRGERIQRAAERRSAPAAGGEACRRRCHAPAAQRAGTPRLAEVSPVPAREMLPVRFTPHATIQQLLPTGSIIDVMA
jgi:hypothetical protein